MKIFINYEKNTIIVDHYKNYDNKIYILVPAYS